MKKLQDVLIINVDKIITSLLRNAYRKDNNN